MWKGHLLRCHHLVCSLGRGIWRDFGTWQISGCSLRTWIWMAMWQISGCSLRTWIWIMWQISGCGLGPAWIWHIWGRDLGTWILRRKRVAEPRGVCFLSLSLSLSFLRSFVPFLPPLLLRGCSLLFRCAMDDMNATHRRLSTTLRHVKKSVTAMDVKIWQQPALGKREEAAAQENPEDLKLPVSPSREFVSRALVSSRKQASTANFWISLDLCLFVCLSVCGFFFVFFRFCACRYFLSFF